MFQDCVDLLLRQHHRDILCPLGPDIVSMVSEIFLIENMLVEKQQGVECLILRRSGNFLGSGQELLVLLDVGGKHRPGFSVFLLVKDWDFRTQVV